jgi:glycosyltransferase involved in cell wall biosynthesis
MRVLLWHVHGSWTTGFVQGPHEYLLPVVPGRGPDGRGRARTWEWPDSALELTPAELADAEIDAVVLQRPEEVQLTREWTGRGPGAELPAIYVEHNAPQGRIAEMRHPLADRDDVVLAHVTHFNDLFWDAGTTPTRVIEHGIPDPGYRYTGELEEAAVAINEPLRRWRVTGTDLLPRLNHDVPLRLFGIGVKELGGIEDLPQGRLHDEMARRRAYLHAIRWTSLGLSLIEAMQLGMPVVALATTEAVEAVPPEAGTISTRVEVLAGALRELIADPDLARARGKEARRVACERFGLRRFLGDWDRLLREVAG